MSTNRRAQIILAALIAVYCAALALCTGCSSARLQREIDRLPWRQASPAEIPPAPDAPAPAPIVQPVPASEDFQWIPGDPTILRVRADLGPRGYALATARAHKHVDPLNQSHDAWMAACNRRPPHRIEHGWAEWRLPSSAEIERRALSFGDSSRTVLMVFVKTGARDPDTGYLHFAWWVNPARQYGPGHRAPVKNLNNQGWQSEL